LNRRYHDIDAVPRQRHQPEARPVADVREEIRIPGDQEVRRMEGAARGLVENVALIELWGVYLDTNDRPGRFSRSNP
jgi:hypothetical protein